MSDEQILDADMQPRRRLGRGLSSLLGRGPQSDGEAQAPAARPVIFSVPIDAVERNPWQPRKDFDADGIRELADSIREHGVLQPILLRELPGGGFQLIAGERRWHASRQAGLSEIPCRVIDVIDQTACELALEENLKRKDLNDVEKARAFKRYLDEFGSSIEELARQLSMSRPAVSNLLRLLELPETVQVALSQGKITAGHARALLKLDAAGQLEMCGRIQAEGMSVREVEAATRHRTPPQPEQTAEQQGQQQQDQPLHDQPLHDHEHQSHEHDSHEHQSHEHPEHHQPQEPTGEVPYVADEDVVPMQRPAKPQASNHVIWVEQHLRGLLGVEVEIRITGQERGQIVIPFDSNDEFEALLRKLRRAAA
jgi:ParB family transcriptional regulator, chromosome partitioning protein